MAGRKIQIEYIKQKSPELAKIEWQDHRPFSLYHYKWDKKPWNLFYRVYDKVNRIFRKEKLIQRNWELQFLGKKNNTHLRHWLLENKSLFDIVPETLTSHIYNRFQSNNLKYSHPLSMLLTMSLFAQRAHHATR